MARDRTAAFKVPNESVNWEAQVSKNYGTSGTQNNYPPTQGVLSQNDLLENPAEDMPMFYKQRDALVEKVNLIESNTRNIRQLNLIMLQEINQSSIFRLKDQIDSLIAETSNLVQLSRDGVKMLHNSKRGNKKTRQAQYELVLQKLQAASRNFLEVQNEIKQSKKDQIARQYRIAKPNATEVEIQNAVDSGRSDVFNQAMVSENLADGQRVLNAVQDRQRELEKVLRSMAELQEIMQEMNSLITNQQEMMDLTELNVDNALGNITNANVDLEKANYHRTKSRKTQWIIVLIVFALLVVVGIIVVVEYLKNKNNPGNSSSNNSSNSIPGP